VRRAAPPVRMLHLGLGNFFRAHPCWYTDHAPDFADWGFAAFTGRGSLPLAAALNDQQGLYTLISRGPAADEAEVIGSLVLAHPAADQDRWLRHFAAPDLAVVTVTVTEAGYVRGPDGGLDAARPEVLADVEALRADPAAAVRTAPAKLVAGLAARRRAGAGPIALVPLDNVPGNGGVARRVLTELAELIDPGLAGWLTGSLSVVTTVVDRITPRSGPDDVRAARVATGVDDACPVVTEPYREWVLSGSFPAGRPGWAEAGAVFTGDAEPYERRKLWLLNGAHSLLAYAALLLGHSTVADAAADEACQSWLSEWWAVAAPHLNRPMEETSSYQRALLGRFANARINDSLARIAADGSQKLPVRILPVLRAERAAGRLPAGATRPLAGWACHLRGLGAPVSDVRAAELVPLASGPLRAAIPRLLRWLAPDLADDRDLTALIAGQAEHLTVQTSQTSLFRP
jgi:fructuronate reductase